MHIIASACYFALALMAWLKISQSKADIPADQIIQSGSYVSLLGLVPISLHLYLVVSKMLEGGGIHLGLGVFISLVFACVSIAYVIFGFASRNNSLLFLSFPFSGFALLLAMLDGATVAIPNTEFLLFKTHLILSVVSYGLFTVSVLHAALMSSVETKLHRHIISPLIGNLPPLLQLEKILFVVIYLGFFSLTLALLTGIVFSMEIGLPAIPFSHKSIFSILAWGFFLCLILGRAVLGWRGRFARRMLFSGFTLLVLGYLGSRFVAEIILHHPQY